MLDQSVKYIAHSTNIAAREAVMDYAAALLTGASTKRLYPKFLRALKELNMPPGFWDCYEEHVQDGSIDEYEELIAVGVYEQRGGLK